MRTFEDLQALAQTRKRKLANNTYMVIREDGGYGVKLHNTEVVIHYQDRIILDSGTWQTVTTKQRINEFSPLRLHQDKGVWYIGRPGESSVPFADGVTFYANGKITGTGPDPRKTIKLRAQVRKYAKDYVAALVAGEIPKPGPGDCWSCCMVDSNGHNAMGGADHILSHIEERYYVPSLLNLCSSRLSQVAMWTIGDIWSGKDPTLKIDSWFKSQVERAIRTFCYSELGLAR